MISMAFFSWNLSSLSVQMSLPGPELRAERKRDAPFTSYVRNNFTLVIFLKPPNSGSQIATDSYRYRKDWNLVKIAIENSTGFQVIQIICNRKITSKISCLCLFHVLARFYCSFFFFFFFCSSFQVVTCLPLAVSVSLQELYCSFSVLFHLTVIFSPQGNAILTLQYRPKLDFLWRMES